MLPEGKEAVDCEIVVDEELHVSWSRLADCLKGIDHGPDGGSDLVGAEV